MKSLSLQSNDLVLIRHGETAWSASGRHTGTTDIPLTPAGEAAASRLAPLLVPLAFPLVFTSPLMRARRTCELAGYGERARVDADLIEWNYGRYEGLTSDQIQAGDPGWGVFSDGGPGGESPAEVGARVDRLIGRLRQGSGPTLVFGHGHLLRVLAARWLDLPPAAGRHFLLDTTTLSVLSHYKGSPALGCWNAPVAHLCGEDKPLG